MLRRTTYTDIWLHTNKRTVKGELSQLKCDKNETESEGIKSVPRIEL